MDCGYLYCITNELNGKQYIGKTYKSVEDRWQEHLREKDKHSHRPLYRALNKYEIDNFYIDIIGKFPKGILEEKEKEYIQEFKTYGKQGYNATLGGDGTVCLTFTEQEVIDKYQELKYITKVAEYYNCCVGTIRDLLNTNNIDIDYAPHRVSIQCKDGKGFIKTFDSIIDAGNWVIAEKLTKSENIGTTAVSIQRAITKKRLTYLGLTWDKYDGR